MSRECPNPNSGGGGGDRTCNKVGKGYYFWSIKYCIQVSFSVNSLDTWQGIAQQEVVVEVEILHVVRYERVIIFFISNIILNLLSVSTAWTHGKGLPIGRWRWRWCMS
jgi:hypothetical protein